MPEFMIAGADAVAPETLHAAFGAAFSDYLIGPFNLPLAQWPQFLARQAVDLPASRVALRNGRVLAFSFVAPRARLRRWRLATMGAVPAARGEGLAPALLDDFVARAAAAGMAQVELECFAQNDRAVRLYRSRGFETVHELHGYTLAADAPRVAGSEGAVAVASRGEAMDWLDDAAMAIAALPLQVTGESLRASPAALTAWRCGQAQLVFSESDGVVTVNSLVDRDAAQAGASALAAKLVADHPGQRIQVPQLQRHDLGGAALERLGFAPLPLHQVLMQRAA